MTQDDGLASHNPCPPLRSVESAPLEGPRLAQPCSLARSQPYIPTAASTGLMLDILPT